MPEIAPFSAIRFNEESTGRDLSALLAPPYDVLDQAAKDQLLAQNEHNIVSVDLPHVPPTDQGPDEVYARAAKRLEDGLAGGVFRREGQPALYVYHQEFEHKERAYTRKMFIARCRLTPFPDGIVLPHELTFDGPKADRLALMKATHCNLSAILSLYPDPQNQIGKAVASIIGARPTVHGRVGDVENRMWSVTDEDVIEEMVATMADKRVYIADGHHRYETALLYRACAEKENGRSLPNDHPANFVMMVFASMDDPGCLILPYCRALPGISLDEVVDAWKTATEACAADAADIVLQDGAGKQIPLRYSDRAKLRKLEPDQCDPWYDLDAAYLHRYLLDDLLTGKVGHAPDIRYVKSAERAIETAKSDSGVALLVNATPMAHLRAVSEAGGLMPQKSTFFHPKIATGLTINPLV
jgi:uncharacterized protein (DUF1015 family)